MPFPARSSSTAQQRHTPLSETLSVRAACWWTVCFQQAGARPLLRAAVFGLVPPVLDSAWRLEIWGRQPEPPPCDTLSALLHYHRQHRHDFPSCPRAGGAPWEKNKTNKHGGSRSASVQALFIWPRVSTAPRHLPRSRRALSRGFFCFDVCVCNMKGSVNRLMLRRCV